MEERRELEPNLQVNVTRLAISSGSCRGAQTSPQRRDTDKYYWSISVTVDVVNRIRRALENLPFFSSFQSSPTRVTATLTIPMTCRHFVGAYKKNLSDSGSCFYVLTDDFN